MLIAVEVLIAGLAVMLLRGGWHIGSWSAGSGAQSSFVPRPIAPIAAGSAPDVQIDDPESRVVVTTSSDGLVHVKDDTSFSGWYFGSLSRVPQLTVTRTPGGVRIERADYSLSGIAVFSHQHIEVQVPAGAHVTIGHCASAEVTGVHNGAEVTSQDGHISLYDVRGDVRAHSDDGHITAHRITANTIALSSDDGHIDATRLAFTGVAPHATIHSDDGSLRLEGVFPAGGAYDFSSTDGRVTLTLDTGSDASVDASSADGSIHVDGVSHDGDDSASYTFRVGSGSSNMRVHSEDGSIHITTNGAN